VEKDPEKRQEPSDLTTANEAPVMTVALLTGGSDRPYVFGLTTALLARGISMDLIGSDELNSPEFNRRPGINYLNLRGSQLTDSSLASKVTRILMYYANLVRYAATGKPRLFHILWNNKFEFFDRTLLMLFYKSWAKKIVFTAHNVNAAKRDSNDTLLNRVTLRIQYRLADHIFVHTERMKQELIEEFGTRSSKVTVIPFGINNSVPNTCLTPCEAKQRLGIRDGEKSILFFGRITPYKGLEYLIATFRQLLAQDEDYRLIIAGRVDKCEEYWTAIKEEICRDLPSERVLIKDQFIPDDETEVYFKAADVLVLPYKHIYQSGVLFLGQNFGLPVIAADVGSLKDDIVEGKTGFVFRPDDPIEFARAIRTYFASDLYANLEVHRQKIREYAMERHSWDLVGQRTTSVYAGLLRIPAHASQGHEVSGPSLDVNAPS
jgi:D-inositol-3-phosphate glycosyltransferase